MARSKISIPITYRSFGLWNERDATRRDQDVIRISQSRVTVAAEQSTAMDRCSLMNLLRDRHVTARTDGQTARPPPTHTLTGIVPCFAVGSPCSLEALRSRCREELHTASNEHWSLRHTAPILFFLPSRLSGYHGSLPDQTLSSLAAVI